MRKIAHAADAPALYRVRIRGYDSNGVLVADVLYGPYAAMSSVKSAITHAENTYWALTYEVESARVVWGPLATEQGD